MEFSYEVKGSYAEVKADGRLNMVSAPNLREFDSDVIVVGSNRIVVNLEKTVFWTPPAWAHLSAASRRRGRPAGTSGSRRSSHR
ncbi:hypothetical protein ABIB45_003126 [Arthrobacter sp. UYCo732]